MGHRRESLVRDRTVGTGCIFERSALPMVRRGLGRFRLLRPTRSAAIHLPYREPSHRMDSCSTELVEYGWGAECCLMGSLRSDGSRIRAIITILRSITA